MPEPRPVQPRKMWKVWLYAVAFAVNLLATGVLVRDVLGGGKVLGPQLFGVVLCGVFAAFLFVELRKPKA